MDQLTKSRDASYAGKKRQPKARIPAVLISFGTEDGVPVFDSFLQRIKLVTHKPNKRIPHTKQPRGRTENDQRKAPENKAIQIKTKGAMCFLKIWCRLELMPSTKQGSANRSAL